ncbi:MAG: hypothetical protein QMB51_01495 [Patescibacteria group bacterium]
MNEFFPNNTKENISDNVEKMNDQLDQALSSIYDFYKDEFSHQKNFNKIISNDLRINVDDDVFKRVGRNDRKDRKRMDYKIYSDKKHVEYLHGSPEWKNQAYGKMVEKIVLIILFKKLNEDFFIFRSNDVDDLNGVDTILIDKETNKIVAALDEVFINSDNSLPRKIQKVFEINKNFGTTIEYPVRTRVDNGKYFIDPRGTIDNVAVSYLSLSKEQVNDFFNDFDPKNIFKTSELEEVIFNYFCDSLSEQIKILEEMQKSNSMFSENYRNYTKIQKQNIFGVVVSDFREAVGKIANNKENK